MTAEKLDFIELKPLDLFFSRTGTWLSRAILWATQEKHEGPSEASHVGCIVTPGIIRRVQAVEALRRVERHSLWDQYAGSKHELNIFRPLNIRLPHMALIVHDLERQVGRKYGYGKLVLHLFRKITRDPRWLRFSSLDQYPICSYLVARSFEKYGYDFGVPYSMATPDDMHDFCLANPEKYQELWPWRKLVA